MRYNIYCSSNNHESGTKFYDIYVLQDANAERAVVIQNWGKVVRSPTRIHTGRIKVTTYNNCIDGNQFAIDKRNEKSLRGYIEVDGWHRPIFSGSEPDPFIRKILDLLKGRSEYKDVLTHFGFSTIESPAVLVAFDDIDSTPPEKSKPKPAPVINDPIWGSW